ncbi:MAG: acetyl/propionyl/methylcrotonyl-CoA carboxylase subunit alpha [Burkholderiaceae bacterium]|jgi:3-methylcrotonyl-CoA carboxylase alpha subunit|nr:acetyl/propionyl/methylcrotonyl-CoA carboxylase subunit alpha [Burkholderiaceae bacterium]MDH5208121.1 acetyl/propionyl/methylcrotonyl-CoA carboxylase subunit alpha [Burkholderiaceae bacterium]
MFKKLLIANRAEIACRVITTARRMGVRTVAVYSDADATSRHVAMADEAVRLGPEAARDSYLRGDLIIDAARSLGADAVHPGYGFLSENASFAQALADAGITFVGPPPFAIHAMGNKSEAKALMERAQVPLVPGYHGDRQEPAFLQAQADAIGYPVLIKASSGGGGKGMRVVSAASEFPAALASCKREALAAFGDERVLIERYVERPRHIEVQVFADTHGNAVYLFERDCSVQRRHQKVLEEAPAPGMTPERRRAMGEAAVAAARAVGYVGAGTVEFIADPTGHFFFMEMNTRLQVEHPVTEMITGFDLVEWQLRVAAGEPLPVSQESLSIRGHAIEARIYAENPDAGFLPATGRLLHLALPDAVEFGGQSETPPASVRIDSGVRQGDSITPHYDPMIAKLIVWGTDRSHALARLRGALADFHIVGVANNVDFLSRLVANPAFARAELDTGLIERERAHLFPDADRSEGVPNEWLAFACARVLADENAGASADPWGSAQGWRLNTHYVRTLTLKSERGVHDVDLEYTRDGYMFHHDDADTPLALSAVDGTRIGIRFGGHALVGDVVRAGDELHLFAHGRHRVLALFDAIAQSTGGDAATGRLTAPMPGKVIAISTIAGARVERGAPLLVMEAMKMEHTIVAPADGVVAEVLFAVGDQVDEGAELVRIETA